MEVNIKYKTVVLVLRSGGDYAFSDVELLAFHLKKQEPDCTIICLWDKIKKPVRLVGVNFIPMENHWKGWWSKMNIFSPEMEKYRPFLFMDLDTAIIGNLQGILPPTGKEDAFITLGAFVGDILKQKWLFSGFMWIPEKSNVVEKIWSTWIRQPDVHIKNNRGDQDFLRNTVKAPNYYWQLFTDKICSFKPKNGRIIRNPKNGIKEAVMDNVPNEISVVCFHGHPRIHQADTLHNVIWVRKYQDECFYNLGIKNAYVINLDERVDRLTSFKKQYFPFDVERIPAIKTSPGVIGCKLSHLEVLKKEHQFPFIVFEDDCVLTENWAVLKKAIEQLPNDWDMLFLGANLQAPVKKYSENLHTLNNAWCAHAIIYNSQKVVDYFIENKDKYKALDILFEKEVHAKFKCFLTYPMMAKQSKGYSNIGDGLRDYDSELESNYIKFAEV